MPALHVMLVAIGSHGDVHPFVGIGRALRERGHRVSVLANDYFQPLIDRAGLGFIPLGTAAEYREVTRDPDLWHRTRGARLVFRSMGRLTEPVYRALAEHDVPGETVVAHSSLALGARIAQDHLGIPTATIHLQPAIIRSAIAPPKLPGMPMASWMPLALRRLIYTLGDRLMLDRWLDGAVNPLRRSLGMKPVRSVLNWVNSPQRIIGLFPSWYAAPQTDWPAQARLTGFPLYDEAEAAPLEESLAAFLDEGDAGSEAPIAFTPGSAMWSADSFFRESAQACALLGRRGLLLSRHADHIPASLPAGVIHVPYAPFSKLLPRCAALVHHAGIGTSAQALAAATPQLLMPFSHDQPDNTQRLEALGVGRSIDVRKYRAPLVAQTLAGLLGSQEVRSACQKAAAHFPDPRALPMTCELIEALAP